MTVELTMGTALAPETDATVMAAAAAIVAKNFMFTLAS
jgi:hypothetical protein